MGSELCSFADEASIKALAGTLKVMIVLTHLDRLRDALGEKFDGFYALLQRYVSSRCSSGAQRVLLDAGHHFFGERCGNEWQGHVRLVRTAVDWMTGRKVETRSILIIGDEKIIPMPCLQNPVGADNDVDSDYPYSAISEADPWEELCAARLAVGRLPVGEASGGGLAERYLENVLSLRGAIPALEPVGFGAAVWEGASRETLATFSRQPITLAPPSGMEMVSGVFGEHRGMMYFNLHGSNEPNEPGWFGESRQRQYPKTVVPKHFRVLSDFNVVGVEACYGGRFIGYREESSCLLSALGHRTLGFLGASRIAFGPPEPPRGLADIVVGDFLKEVGAGASLGDALMAARNSLMEAAKLDAHSRLSIFEFNLFGDPEVCPFRGVEVPPRSSSVEFSGAGVVRRGPETAASRLRDQIRAHTQTARQKIGVSIRRIDVGALIGAEIQRSLARCREVAAAYVRQHFGEAFDGHVREACCEADGKMVLMQHYIQTSQGGPLTGMSLKQDLLSANVLQSFHIK